MTRSTSKRRSASTHRNSELAARMPAWRDAVEQAVQTGRQAAALVRSRGLQAVQIAQQRGAGLTQQVRAAAQARIEPVTEKVAGKMVVALTQAEKRTTERVGRALNRLGVPSQKDIDKLTRSVARLSSQIEKIAVAGAKPQRQTRAGSRRASATA